MILPSHSCISLDGSHCAIFGWTSHCILFFTPCHIIFFCERTTILRISIIARLPSLRPSIHIIIISPPFPPHIMFSSIWQRPCIAEADNMHVTNHESDIQGTIDQPPSISPNDCESTILARRVLPSLRIPVSKSTMPVSQRGPASGSERSDSPYTRRSVTGMKRLMPLRLASPQVSPRPSPQSEFDLAFSEAPRSFNFIYDQRQDPSDSRYVPWMQFETDSPLLNDLDSRKFRETPIYSEPGSPFLARAYFSDENDCPKCLPPGSPCRNVCIVESYGDIAEMQSPQLEYNTDHVESFDGESEAGTESSEYESVSTGLTSLPSSSLSDLSIKCRGLEVMQFEPFWVESTPAPWLAPALEEQKELVTQRYPAESWIASESSRCSSPVCISEVLSVSKIHTPPQH
jgi:hypothetical protein